LAPSSSQVLASSLVVAPASLGLLVAQRTPRVRQALVLAGLTLGGCEFVVPVIARPFFAR
jgi:hypothetical protein